MLNATDRSKLASLLDKLAGAVEELLLTGLTTASQSTRQTLDVSFREASRLRLLRLSSTLRVANEELGRFTRNESEFSSKRLSFFLNRAWLLARGWQGRSVWKTRPSGIGFSGRQPRSPSNGSTW